MVQLLYGSGTSPHGTLRLRVKDIDFFGYNRIMVCDGKGYRRQRVSALTAGGFQKRL